jgi:DNA-binding CsgD family transcriptional regulator
LWVRALVHEQRGETAEAQRAARDGESLVGMLEPSRLKRTVSCDLAAIGADHDPHRVLREMTAIGGPQLEDAGPLWTSWLFLRLVRATVAAGSLETAEHLANCAAVHAARLRLPAGSVRATLGHAEVLLARDQPARAAALALEAATAAERVPAPLDCLEARLLAGRALAAAGETAAATTALQHVADEALRNGALRVHRAAARQVRRLGRRLPARSRADAHGNGRDLSTRERHVADLVARGHSNKQVAATLYLSEKTVANTLTRVYAKLGVRSRTQLARTHIGGPDSHPSEAL